ncbi:hypothetical protein L0663_01555 [Dyadobacter sp. CY107]|uniref:hypothetical protein n=1 Tax=Dyadobacter fanqingshengii TaxID=2906443 RepID=UPI001F40EEA3|nr:hypothetical protein [Dyadobacter fanqingshengii]MCF2502050.1 hypothetical protein [Dyadobacter fanqingshengii]
MGNIREVTKSIARIWRLHKTRESLYRSAMRMADLGSCRKTCSLGYMNSVLFRKEVGEMYDCCKYSLEDAKLSSIATSDPAENFQEAEKVELFLALIEIQDRIISAYHILSQELDPSSEQPFLMTDHVHKLNELNQLLEKEIISMGLHAELFAVA